jgi:hypothetical protein
VEHLARLVVRQPRLPGRPAGGLDVVRVEEHGLVLVRNLDRPLGDPLPVPHGRRQHLGHGRPALDLGRLGGLLPAGPDPGVEVVHGGQQHAGLAERGQHLLDVAQERRVGADDEHHAPGETLALGVEQVGGPVQRDGGLAGAGAALDDEDAAVRGADDLVLFRLDGRDDVRHSPGAGRVERREQCRFAGGAALLSAEFLVPDRGHPPVDGADMPATAHAFRGERGRGVERARGGRPPVDQQRAVAPVPGQVLQQADAADVPALAVAQVQPAEAQALLNGVEPPQTLGQLGCGHVAFGQALVAEPGPGQHLVEPVPRLLAQFVKPPVEPGDVILFAVVLDP